MLEGMVYLGVSKVLSEQKSMKLGFESRNSGETSQTGMQRIPDRRNDENERALTKILQITFRNFQNRLA